jgi:hypothetical protein
MTDKRLTPEEYIDAIKRGIENLPPIPELSLESATELAMAELEMEEMGWLSCSDCGTRWDPDYHGHSCPLCFPEKDRIR